ncbi:hypothetical protein K2173_019160 [Erythroxylum novogranatense]|uniref:Protein ECERIFERUM 26-like n=1 Tax=Erythroxylum novogranatense TaxID=1862640 RepID=A0AAV8SST3_9ROSI|nr:hypothetical protein K2173_019160 [Erythroxylum novogranatense]
MVSSNDQGLVYNVKLSSIGPSRITGSDVVSEPNGMDLVMKQHYLKFVYFFTSQVADELTIMRIKESMFYWSNDYYMICGRFRRSEAGRPYMKCNDCGVRFVEAECDKTVDEWLEMREYSRNSLLVYHLPIGPEIWYSPPVFVQVTKFKCGGVSLGFSWAHILGDAFSASECFNVWGQFLAGLKAYGPVKTLQSPKKLDKPETQEPLSIKRVDSVGDHWITANNCKMESFTFHLTASQFSHLLSNIWNHTEIDPIPSFESLCALIWKCVAKVREGHEPDIVTVCKKDPKNPRDENLSNSQVISYVKADCSILQLDLRELATLLVDQAVEENSHIEAAAEKENGVADYILYGANLTFVDFEKANCYGLELNGHKPEFVHCTIQGVGDEGAVLVFPWPKDSENGEMGRVVTLVLPEKEMVKLKTELMKNGLLPESDNE